MKLLLLLGWSLVFAGCQMETRVIRDNSVAAKLGALNGQQWTVARGGPQDKASAKPATTMPQGPVKDLWNNLPPNPAGWNVTTNFPGEVKEAPKSASPATAPAVSTPPLDPWLLPASPP